MLGDRRRHPRGQVLLAGPQQRQVGFQQVLHVTIRDLHGGLGVQVVPDLGACVVLAKAQRADMRDDVYAIRRALDLACLRACRAKDRAAAGALGRRATIAQTGDVLDAIQRLDPFSPDRMAVDQASSTPQTLDQLGSIANVRTGSKAARRLHPGSPSNDRAAAPTRPILACLLPVLPGLQKNLTAPHSVSFSVDESETERSPRGLTEGGRRGMKRGERA